MPDPTKSVDDLVAAYTPAESDAFVAEVTKRRYPLGHRLLTHLRSDKTHCYDRFFTDRSSADRALALLSVLVHECGHSLDLSLSSPGSNHYVIAGDLELTCTFGDTTERRGLTFARSQILNDEFQALRPPCPPGEKEECDTYANLYLGGSSGDDVLQGGDQGFNMLIEEWVQYIHALATDYAIAELLTRDGVSISSRDGVLTFMWYVERYLRMARLEYPEAYRYLAGGDGGCWRDVILALWDRSEVYLAATKDLQGLGIRDAAIAALVENDEMKGEIDRIRAAGTCP